MKNLFKISLIISIAGILLLLFLSAVLEPKPTKINNITEKMLNKKVKVSGTIEKIEDKETFQILSIKDETGKIEVLCECENNNEINLTTKNAQEVIVTGKVQEYKNSLQLNAEKIIKK